MGIKKVLQSLDTNPEVNFSSIFTLHKAPRLLLLKAGTTSSDFKSKRFRSQILSISIDQSKCKLKSFANFVATHTSTPNYQFTNLKMFRCSCKTYACDHLLKQKYCTFAVISCAETRKQSKPRARKVRSEKPTVLWKTTSTPQGRFSAGR